MIRKNKYVKTHLIQRQCRLTLNGLLLHKPKIYSTRGAGFHYQPEMHVYFIQNVHTLYTN